jgi:hypothetical protein
MLLIQKIKYKLAKLLQRFKFVEPNWGKLFGFAIGCLVIVGLSGNIYNSFNKGMETVNSLHEEEMKLIALQAENKSLQNQVRDFESIDYKKIYARENLNLGEKGDRLYYVDRPADLKNIEELPQEQVAIDFKDNLAYWKKLILGL